MAQQSWQVNAKHPTFRKLFPEYLQEPPSSSSSTQQLRGRQKQKQGLAGEVNAPAAQTEASSSSAAGASSGQGTDAADDAQNAVPGTAGVEGSEEQPSAKELIDRTIEQAMQQMRMKPRAQGRH